MRRLFLVSVIAFLYSFVLAQQTNDKVQLRAVDGKTYSGIIKEIRGDKYRVKYDGVDFEAWLTKDQFTLLNTAALTTATGQKTGSWQVGDTVEAYDMYNNTWSNGTVALVLTDRNPVQWRVTFDDVKGHTFEYLSLTDKQIRARGVKGASFVLNQRVDAYYTSGDPKGRGTIIELKGNGRYKVRYDGCAAHWDEEVDWSQLRPESKVAATDADITATFGKWAMFVYSYPNTVTDGNYVYRVYGTGAKAPPLQINANGTYVWYDEFNKPPVKGTWTAHAKIAGVTMGTEAVNGILLKDSHGVLWKIYKDRPDHVEARKMCSGETQGGSKLK